MWNGRASRRTRVRKSQQKDKSSAGIGTTVEHPLRERLVKNNHGRAQRPSPTQTFRFLGHSATITSLPSPVLAQHLPKMVAASPLSDYP